MRPSLGVLARAADGEHAVAGRGFYGGAARLMLRRAAAWILPDRAPWPWPVGHALVLPLAALGAILLLRRRAGALVLWTVVAGAIPSIPVVYAGPRYRTPVMGCLCLLAGLGAVAVLDRVRRLVVRRASSTGSG